MRNFSLVLVCGAVIAIAGCGGGDDSSTTASTSAGVATGLTPLSQEDFVSQANAVCADVNSQIEALAPPTNDVASVAKFTKQGLAIVVPAAEKLAEIVPPADLQGRYTQWLGALAKQVSLEQGIQSAAQAGDADTVNASIKELQSENEVNDQLASALGLTECAKDAQPQG
jgi:hypothetical protein